MADMSYPQCGKEMEPGYVSSGGYPIAWTTQKRKFSRIVDESSGEIPLCGLSVGKGVPACVCRTCRKVLIDYGTRMDG